MSFITQTVNRHLGDNCQMYDVFRLNLLIEIPPVIEIYLKIKKRNTDMERLFVYLLYQEVKN